KTGHNANKCWAKGGKEAQNTPEWYKKKQKGDKVNTTEDDSGSESAAVALLSDHDQIHRDLHNRLYEDTFHVSP
ncbi:hypothetical protein K439DRAFT_1344025, partial [Ramaria rubella]